MQQVSINDSLEGPGKKQFWEQHIALHNCKQIAYKAVFGLSLEPDGADEKT